jgi:hypothetical protein
MAITNYKKQVEQPDDDYRSLLCTEPGCGRPWSVKIDKPKCSRHQWPDIKKIDDSFARQNYVPKEYNPADPRAWAKRIIDKHEAGIAVNPATLKFAQEALR